MRYGIDLDGCVTDFMGGVTARYEEQTGIHIDYQDIRWDFLSLMPTFPTWDKFWAWVRDEELMAALDPYPHAVETVKNIARGSYVIFITNRHPWNWSATGNWLERHGLGDIPVCFTDRKWEIPCNLYIEDRPEFVERLARVVLNGPQGYTLARVYRMVRPWNHPVPGVTDLNDWRDLPILE